MKINLNSLMKPKANPPPKELVAPFTAEAEQIFKRCGMIETELTKKVAPLFGRILFDIGDSSLSIWSGGKPEIADTGYATQTKGMLLAGGVGIGKSMILRCVAATIHAEYLTVPDLSTLFSQQGSDGFWNAVGRANRWDLMLDDLGAEKAVKSYSNALPIEELLYRRYDLWQRHGVRTHIATNLVGDQVEERYGMRIRDRLKEMMTPVVSNGKSLRK